MTIREVLEKYYNIEIELLLMHVLKKSKEFLFMEPDYILTSKHLNILSKLIKRREKGEPVAYILGHKDFDGLRFKVTKDVLIPRPETEELVHKVLQVCKVHKVKDKIRILDVGTGSGTIIVSLAKKLSVKSYQFEATDISKKALQVAKQNAKTLLAPFYHHTSMYDGKVKFIQSDLFQNISGKFDVITANLPYVPLKMLHKHLLHKTRFSSSDPFQGLKFEPAFALTDGTSTWQIYKRFFQEVGGHVNPGALILLEIDPASRKFLTEYQKKYLPQAGMKFHRDFRNLWRFAEIKIPG